MSFTFKYSSRILEDLQNGYDYYIEQEAPKAAERFLQEIDKAFNRIKQNPYIFSTRYNDVRCGVPKYFPYLIHYRIIEYENLVQFISVVNTYKKPFW